MSAATDDWGKAYDEGYEAGANEADDVCRAIRDLPSKPTPALRWLDEAVFYLEQLQAAQAMAQRHLDRSVKGRPC